MINFIRFLIGPTQECEKAIVVSLMDLILYIVFLKFHNILKQQTKIIKPTPQNHAHLIRNVQENIIQPADLPPR